MIETRFVVHTPFQYNCTSITITSIVMAENKEIAIMKAIDAIDEAGVFAEIDVDKCDAYPMETDEVVFIRWV